MNDWLNSERLSKEVKDRFFPYCQKMLTIHGREIQSIFIYGSATGVNYIPQKSDINSGFVFRSINFEMLRRSLRVVSSGIRKKIAAPLFLTKEHIQSSLDVFPIEFLDMKENYTLIFGEDVLSPLEIKSGHIRLFCEQQIKGKLIRIRQAFLEVGLKKKGVEALLKESLHSLIPVFRNLIRLKGQTPSVHKLEILRQISQEFSLDENVFLPIYRDTADDEKIDNQDIELFLKKYISELATLADRVDQL
ncbi:MAG: hypothetical protein WC552_00050 [Candidatus Omnitrophota bacterium]